MDIITYYPTGAIKFHITDVINVFKSLEIAGRNILC